MRFQTRLVVVVWLLLWLVAVERWGESAEGSAPTWLKTPDTIRPERVLWEGVAMPLEGGAAIGSAAIGGAVGSAVGGSVGSLAGILAGVITSTPARPPDPQAFPQS